MIKLVQTRKKVSFVTRKEANFVSRIRIEVNFSKPKLYTLAVIIKKIKNTINSYTLAAIIIYPCSYIY